MVPIHRRDFMRGLACLLLSVSAATLKIEAAEAKPKLLPMGELKLSLRAAKSEYLLGEPIALYATLTNPHDQPAWGPKCFGWRRDIEVKLTRDGRCLLWDDSYGAPAGYPGEPPTPQPMPAKSTARAKRLVFCAGEVAPLLSSPGPIQITATQRIMFWKTRESQSVTSNPVEILIREPKGVDAEAYQWIREHNLVEYLGDLLYLRERLKETHLQAFRALLKKYPKSTYAPFAAFALAQKQLFDEKYPEAVESLIRVADEYPKSAVAEDALAGAAAGYWKQGKFVEAHKKYLELIRRYPDTQPESYIKAAMDQFAQYPGMLFYEDRRLDAKVRIEMSVGMSTADIAAKISETIRVPLRVTPELQKHVSPVSQVVEGTARSAMEFTRGSRGEWVREPDGGYRLVPKPEEPKP